MKVSYEPVVWEGKLSELPLITDRQIIYRTFFEETPIEIFAYIRSASTQLIVCGQDALNKDRPELPFFYRWSWYSDVDCSFITINDPTLHRFKTIIGGWYQFSPEISAIGLIADVVKRVVSLAEISENDIVLYGASAGGFWALMTGALFPAATVVVEIPQTDMFRYPAPHHARALFNECYPGLSEAQIRERYAHKLRVSDFYRHQGQAPGTIIYHQNILDPLHIEMQMKPFAQDCATALGGDPKLVPKRLDFRFYERSINRGGHCPMDKPDSIKAMMEPFT
jgi:hypothetical protein